MRDLRRGLRSFALAVVISHACAITSPAEPLLTTRRVASGLNRPLYVTAPPGDTERLFIVEQHSGDIKIMDLESGNVHETPFLNISTLSRQNEQGLLGLAFHPNYQENGLFYVNFTGPSGTTAVRRFQVSADNPDVADPDSSENVISYTQPFPNHNGGWIGFGPNDGYLYISSGDGGSGNDPDNRAQDITNQPLGKVLRLDVDGDDFTDARRNFAIPPTNPFVGTDGDDEIWAYGLRNPWRMSFDRETGDLYIADVGQGQIEEINFQPADSTGGENYGWRVKEGTRLTGLDDLDGLDVVDPIHEYTHSVGFSITGGYVYRGEGIGGELEGTYFFADFVSERIWSLRFENGEVSDFTERTQELRPPRGQGSVDQIASFGEDALGNLYIVDLGGEIFRIEAVPATGDVDLDGDVDLVDFNLLREAFGQTGQELNSDLDGDENVGLGDFILLKEFFGTDSRSQAMVGVPEPASITMTVVAILLGASFQLLRQRRKS